MSGSRKMAECRHSGGHADAEPPAARAFGDSLQGLADGMPPIPRCVGRVLPNWSSLGLLPRRHITPAADTLVLLQQTLHGRELRT